MQKTIKTVQTYVWYLLVILTPLWINVCGAQPFELPKVVWARTLIWILTALALADALLTQGTLRRDLQNNPLLRPTSLLILVVGVTTITAVDWRLSLWGSYDRGQGALTHISYALLFLLASVHLRTVPQIRHVIIATVVSSTPIILLSLAQSMGWNPLGFVSDARSPIYATLGRANFVGAYLMMLMPLAGSLLLTSRQRRARIAWKTLLILDLLVIGLTLARSTWLATATVLSLFALLMWGRRLSHHWLRIAWISVGMLGVSGPLDVLWLGQRQLGSTAARLSIWKSTLHLIVQRPLLGYGADVLGIVFPRVYPPELVYYQGRDFFVDRAHNIFLEWTVMAGIPGVLAFSLVFGMFIIVMVNALRQPHPPEKRVLLIAILTTVLGNIVNTLVSFDITPTAVITWLLMGMGVGLSTSGREQMDTAITKKPYQRWVIVVALFVGTSTAIWHMNIRPLLADIVAHTANQHAKTRDWTAAITASERAITYWPIEPTYHLRLADIYWQQAIAEPNSAQQWLSKAESALLNARELRPQSSKVWVQTALFYTAVAQDFGGDTRALTDRAYQQARILAPNHATIYTAWGRAALHANDPQAAAPLLRQAVILDATNGEAYIYLGAAEFALGRFDIALADYLEAVRLLPNSSDAYAGLAQCYWQLSQPQQALLAVEKALHYNPENAQALVLREKINNLP